MESMPSTQRAKINGAVQHLLLTPKGKRQKYRVHLRTIDSPSRRAHQRNAFECVGHAQRRRMSCPQHGLLGATLLPLQQSLGPSVCFPNMSLWRLKATQFVRSTSTFRKPTSVDL